MSSSGIGLRLTSTCKPSKPSKRRFKLYFLHSASQYHIEKFQVISQIGSWLQIFISFEFWSLFWYQPNFEMKRSAIYDIFLKGFISYTYSHTYPTGYVNKHLSHLTCKKSTQKSALLRRNSEFCVLHNA